MPFDNNTLLIINRYGMSDAAPELQMKLLTTYLQLLLEGDWLPRTIAFYGEGVKLAILGSPVLDSLKQLHEKGVYLILCSTCLSYYDVRDQVQVGIVGGMIDIMEAMKLASKVITL